jgi:hypothetical protein
MVWITRIEPRKPKPGIEIGEPDGPGINGPACLKVAGVEFEPFEGKGRGLSKRPIYVDMREIPIQTRLDWYEKMRGRTRLTKRGWDRFMVGEFEIVDQRLTDIVSQIKSACMARNLLWRFEIRRVKAPKGADPERAWYLVSRLR